MQKEVFAFASSLVDDANAPSASLFHLYTSWAIFVMKTGKISKVRPEKVQIDW